MPSIYFSSIVKSRSNPFLEPTSTKQKHYQRKQFLKRLKVFWPAMLVQSGNAECTRKGVYLKHELLFPLVRGIWVGGHK